MFAESGTPSSSCIEDSFANAEYEPGAGKLRARILVKGQEAVLRTARTVFPIADQVDDEPTANLLTQRMQVHEKTAWMLRSLSAS